MNKFPQAFMYEDGRNSSSVSRISSIEITEGKHETLKKVNSYFQYEFVMNC